MKRLLTSAAVLALTLSGLLGVTANAQPFYGHPSPAGCIYSSPAGIVHAAHPAVTPRAC